MLVDHQAGPVELQLAVGDPAPRLRLEPCAHIGRGELRVARAGHKVDELPAVAVAPADIVLEKVLDGGTAGLANVQKPQHTALELSGLGSEVARWRRQQLAGDGRRRSEALAVPPRLRLDAKHGERGG